MSWIWGDGFDCYRDITDAYVNGTYWDSAPLSCFQIAASGRFTVSRSLSTGTNSSQTTAGLQKASGANDAIHHLNFAYQQTSALALSGTTSVFWFSFSDGATAQCTVVVRSDGAILLASGSSFGTVLATYTGAVTAIAPSWFAFEVEVVINNATGRFRVRKLGNISDDFDSGAVLNTRAGTTNNYANRLSVGTNSGFSLSLVDDLLWRSDPSAVPFVGDVRCYTRMPAGDAAVTWTRSGSVVPVTPFVQAGAASSSNTTVRYTPFVATCSGSVGSVSLSLALGYTGNAKCTLFNDSSGAPGSILGSANVLNNPITGNNTFTLASPPAVTQGTKYWVGFAVDTGVSNGLNIAANNFAGAYSNSAVTNPLAYASFPVANPTGLSVGFQANIFTVNITPTTAANANLVAELTPDAGGYVFSANVGDTDLYGVQPITGTPSSVIAVTTRLLAQKSDAGTRNAAVVVKSGGTTNVGTSTALNTSFSYVVRTDVTDPATGAAWTPVAVNNLNVGARVTA